MTRMIFGYGTAAGGLVVAGIIIGLALGTDGGSGGLMIGYLIMLVAFSLIFVAVKRYRDVEQGGVIRFSTAFGLGMGIAGVASAVYVIGWEGYLWSSNYTFIDDYAQATLAAKTSEGASASEIAALTQSLNDMRSLYDQPLLRMGVTFLEILPVGLVVSLIAAALLRNSRFLPARTAR
ncbi:DUF4199 domain-containing protein [Blastomonas sp.]|uniref:DUF4199 domain-containing protein n=1 Tax=Blastomonas sp. TaxID=1909299 RepID=UPI00359432A4